MNTQTVGLAELLTSFLSRLRHSLSLIAWLLLFFLGLMSVFILIAVGETTIRLSSIVFLYYRISDNLKRNCHECAYCQFRPSGDRPVDTPVGGHRGDVEPPP